MKLCQCTSLVKLCREIASKINISGNGVMQQDELQILVKHLDPAFINVPINQIEITDPKIKALIGKEAEVLVQYLSNTYNVNWVRAITCALTYRTVSHEFDSVQRVSCVV